MNQSALWGTHAGSVPDADDADAHARDQLLERCKALPHDQHILYRALSERAHPTATVAALSFRIRAMGKSDSIRRPRRRLTAWK